MEQNLVSEYSYRMKFKDYYTTECAELIAEKLLTAAPTFDAAAFVTAIEHGLTEGYGPEGPAFGARQDIFAAALEAHLPQDYERALQVLEQILGPPLEQAEGMFTHGWWLWPIGRYVERNALSDPEASLRFTRELTRRFTGEFAVRPLLAERPKETLAVVRGWAVDPDVHVRRLASEGLRISLPWARKLTVALEYFAEYREILDILKSAPEKFVQKSVGNNLNDLMKADPDKAWRIIHDWEQGSPSPETRWIIKHGTRSLRK